MNSGSPVFGEKSAPPLPECLAQVDRIASSSGFRHSDPIRNVLVFLAKQASEIPGQTVKEHQIATSALGRESDFDPRFNSTVRVIVTRLRAKLAEYYSHEGIDDPILVELPRGAYALSFTTREVGSRSDAKPVLDTTVLGPPLAPVRVNWISRLGVTAGILAITFCCYFLGRYSAYPRNPPVLKTFWNSFLKTGDPLIVFSNPIFRGTPETGMRLLDPEAFHTAGTNDTFTGTGEVMAAQGLTEELVHLAHKPQAKRARLFTWDEAVAYNLVIVGGPAQSSVFTQLPRLQKFVLKPPTEQPFLGQEAIWDTKPDRGPSYYLPIRDGDKGEEYGIVAITPGASSDHQILILAGTNTYGTEAAARFVCNPTLLHDLYSWLHVTGQTAIPAFEALIKVEVRGGAPLEPQLMMVYKRHQ